MRPMLGDDAFGRPRATDNDTPSTLHAPPAPQMTYALGDESTVDVSLQQSSAAFQRPREMRKHNGHEISGAAAAAAAAGGPRPSDKDGRDGRPSSSKGPVEALKSDDFPMSRPDSPVYRPSGVSNPSQPMTPIFLGTSAGASALSSVSSRRNSLSGSLDLGSQAVSTDGETDKETPSNMMDSGSAPQLIMPSIKMPSRRPFTEAGKSMPRLKVLIAGDSGIGKTSLVKAIVQSCEHIVHVDPITPSPASSVIRAPAAPRRGSRRLSSRPEVGTTQITEIFASTKPYPEWWSDLDDSRILKRRKSVGDTVLDRNICFVDTPGYGCGSSAMDTISPVVTYVESHLQRMCSNSLADGDMLNMLGGDGGVQVDVVLYMISHRLKPVDVQYLRQLSSLTNVIPVLARADLMSPDQVAASKEQINSQLQEADIRPFGFAAAFLGQTVPRSECTYAISSATGSDHDIMDASLLMSSDYVQPLIPTELVTLVEQMFSQDGASWLRHSAARKYIQWRRSGTTKPMELYQPASLSSSNAQLTASQALYPALGATSSFAIARVADHTEREERLARLQLASWAVDLQKSLDKERASYERLARGDRAVWLTERLNECVQDGTLVPVAGRGKSSAETDGKSRQNRSKMRRGSPTKSMQHQDPLGLLEVAAELRHKGLVALEVLGSLSVLGGLALWLSRHYWHFQPYEWAATEWDKFWSGGR